MPREPRDKPGRAPTLDLVDRPCPVCGAESAGAAVVASGVDWEYRSCSNRFTFARCPRCSTVYLNPRPALEDFEVIYPPSYYTQAEAEGRGGAGWLVRRAWDRVERLRAAPLAKLFPEGADVEVLDIGCGDGRLLRALRRLNGPSWALTGVEQGLSRATIEAARREGGVTLLDGLYEQQAFEPERFDLILAQQVLEHVVEPRRTLEKAFSELRPGGFAVLDTPNYDGVDRRLFSGGLWGGYHIPRHLTLFTPETLAALAERVGFEVWQVRPLLSPVFWIMTAHNGAVAAGLPRVITERLTYRSAPLLALTTALELPTLVWSGATSNMRALLKKPGGHQ